MDRDERSAGVAETVKISHEDLESLAATLDTMSGQLSESQRLVLVALFEAAGRAPATDPQEVEGYIGLLLPAFQAATPSDRSTVSGAFLGAVSRKGGELGFEQWLLNKP
jgi:hypothetical protein